MVGKGWGWVVGVIVKPFEGSVAKLLIFHMSNGLLVTDLSTKTLRT